MSRVVVLGGGESGVGAALLAKKKGYEVFLSDGGQLKTKYRDVLLHNDIAFEEETHTIELIFNADEVVKSPGIPDHIPLIKALREREIPVISEIEFGARYSNARFIAITGSNGKTTTTLLTYHILKREGLNVGIAGNVGMSLAAQVAEGLDVDWYVLEVSSFQLDGMYEFKADIAMLLNITEDHLDRYEYDVMKYARSKMRIAQNQDEHCWFIYCADDPMTLKIMQEYELHAKHAPFTLNETKIHNHEGTNAFANNKQITINPNSNPLTMTIQELALQGKHNLYNSMASGIAARIMEVRKDIIRECLTDFQNVEHRLEHVNTVYGMNFINDSKATNVNSTWYALESMSTPTVWIAGGVDKGNDYDQIMEMVKKKVKLIVCLGKDNSKLKAAFDGVVEIVEVDNMRDAVYRAYKAGEKGDTVLLSPACASFDLFQDYEDRGRQFKEAVRNL